MLPVNGSKMNRQKAKEGTIQLLGSIDDDPAREGLLGTPDRVSESMEFLTSGYHIDVRAVLHEALFTQESEDLVIVREIDYFSLCEHHLLPFFGKVHIGYIPKGRIVGISKLVRVVEALSRRLQVQERFTAQLADLVYSVLAPHGVGVIVSGYHTCMAMRGVRQAGASVTTSAMRGVMLEDLRTREEFLRLASTKQ